MNSLDDLKEGKCDDDSYIDESLEHKLAIMSFEKDQKKTLLYVIMVCNLTFQ
jgi:hypothetical protein